MKIYIDLDDTLVAFLEGLKEFNVKNAELTKQYLHLPRDQWPKDILLIDGGIRDAMNTPNFFRDLPPMAGFKDLWGTALELAPTFTLTAYPTTSNDRKRVSSEKNYWCHSLLPEFEDYQFICCAREDKIKYATSRTEMWDSKYTCTREVFSPNVLVDDLSANISAWEKAGGIGILFKNSNQAVEDLKKVFNAQY